MSWLRQLFSHSHRYDELSESIREHLEEKIADLIDRGMTREAAERSARREFGNVTLIEERSREVWQWPTVRSIWGDVRYAFRQLRKSFGFTLAVVCMLALSTAASGVFFSIVNDVLVHPLPFANPDRLVALSETNPTAGKQSVAYLDFQDWKTQNSSFSELAGYTSRDWAWSKYIVSGKGQSEEVEGTLATGNLFSLLDIKAALGRTLLPEDDASQARVVVLSHSLWERRYHGNTNVIGSSIEINDELYTIIGVLRVAKRWRFAWPSVLSAHEFSR